MPVHSRFESKISSSMHKTTKSSSFLITKNLHNLPDSKIDFAQCTKVRLQMRFKMLLFKDIDWNIQKNPKTLQSSVTREIELIAQL